MIDRGCFVDTTVLTEALLKTKERRRRARAKILEYNRSVLPVYAIKELKSGPLRGFVWLHNRLVDTRSFSRAVGAIHNLYRSPHLKGSAEEALQLCAEMLLGSSLSYADTKQKTQAAVADSFRLSLRRRIEIAWRERRKLTTEVIDELSCFAEIAPTYNEETAYIDNPRLQCDLSDECCLAADLRRRRGELRKILKALRGQERNEDQRRRAALNRLLKKPARIFGNKYCRGLGDAYFALQCPKDCAILTSNAKDHSPLAGALGREVHEFEIV